MPARRSPSQQRSRLTYDAVVEAAAQVFERHGYAAGTTNRIAQRAGVSVGSLYQYFDDKDAVLVAVARAHLAEAGAVLAPQIAALRDDPEPEAMLAAFTAAVVDLHRDRPRLHRLLFEEAPLPADLRAEVLATERAIAAQVAAYLRRRPAPPRNPDLTARLLVEAVETLAHRFVLHPDGTTTHEAFVAETARLLAAGL